MNIDSCLQTAVSAAGLLSGHETVADAVADEPIERLAHMLLFSEILPAFPEFWQGDAARAALTKRGEEAYLRLTQPDHSARLADLSAGLVGQFRTENLPVLLAAWQAGRLADATVFTFTTLAFLCAHPVAGWQPGLGDPFQAALAAPPARDADGELDFEAVTAWLRAAIEDAGFFPVHDDAWADRLAMEAAAAYLTLDAEGITETLDWTVS
ncbi:MAG: hypothetical protein FWG11_03645 [Promicromonosporaceae bacterium]|nr:hypothetical protein [Promicromonosporaceae bacterium]